MSQKDIRVRLSVEGGGKSRQEFSLTSDVCEKAMRKIKQATAPASKSLAGINIIAEQARFGMLHLAGGSGTLGVSLMRLGPAGLAAAASLGGVVLAMKHSFQEFKEAEKALGQLNAALRATDFASGMTSEKILRLGDAVERNTLFKKEAIMQAAANLTAFGNIHGKVFERALASSADLAVRLGTDIVSAADTLGQVLEKPENGLGRLSRKFGDLSFAQRESIENFNKQGDVMSKQTVILDHITSRVGGLAAAQVTGLTGAVNTLSDAFGNLGQSIWNVASDMKAVQATFAGMTKAVNAIRKEIDPTSLEREKKLVKEIARIKNSRASKEHDVTDLPELKSREAELAKVREKIAKDKKQQETEEARSLAGMKKDKFNTNNDKLMGLNKKYVQERTDLTSSPQQKMLTEHATRRQEIEAMRKGGASDEYTQKALSGLQDSTTLKLASVPGARTGEQAREQFEAQKQALDEWRANLDTNIDGAKDKNEEYAAQIEQIYNTRLREIYANSLANSTDWSDGAQRAMLDYSSSAMNAAANAEKVFGTAASKAEDLLTNAVMNGKLSFDSLKDFALSTIEDITRAMIRQSIMGPLMGGLGGMMGGMGGGLFGLFHEGGVVGESKVPHRFLAGGLPGMPDFSNIPRLHSGLAPDEFPAILQRGETVLPRNAGYKGGPGHGDAPINIIFNITTPNVQSFTESRGQLMATFAGEIDRFRKRNR